MTEALLHPIAWLLALAALCFGICALQRCGLDGLLLAIADAMVRWAANLRAMARWWKLFRIEGPRLYRELQADELGGGE